MFGGTGGLENQVMRRHCRLNFSAFTPQLLNPCRMFSYFVSHIPSCWIVKAIVNISYHLYEKQITMYFLNITICVHPEVFRNWTSLTQKRWMKKLFPGAEGINFPELICYFWEMSNSSPLNYIVTQTQMYFFHFFSMSLFSVYKFRYRFVYLPIRFFGSYTGIFFPLKYLALQADRLNPTAKIIPVMWLMCCNVIDLIGLIL